MYGNRKKAAALGLAVALGCMMPMSTMLAAEDDAENAVSSVSDNDVLYEEENADGEENIPENDDAGDIPDEEKVSEEDHVSILSEAEIEPEAEVKGAEAPQEKNEPVITITRGGVDKTGNLGGEITFEYANNWGTLFEISVTQIDGDASVYYYLDKMTDKEAKAKEEADMDSLGWGQKQSPSMSIEPLDDGCYVVYVKVEAGGQKYYACSSGIVVDTQKPVIKGVESGKTYPEGTLFQVEDANLDYVLVNEQSAAPENGNYKVAVNGTSCVIRAKDKAGNEETCSVTVFGSESPEPDKPDDSNVILESGEYALKAGVKYHLGAGSWKVGGDKSVYQGGIDFYVTADGSYQFTK